MITIAPMLFSLLRVYGLACVTTASPLIILGIYYGFLSTLPIGPSQLLCIRAFLLEGEGKESESPGTVAKSGIVIAAISGLTISQLALFLSVYWPSLYILWLKPHLLTLLVLPYMLFYWYRIQEFESSGWLTTTNSIYDPRVRLAFLDSFLFQALNPVLLPSPVMTRLMSVFLFRYSQVSLFIVGTTIGWLGGQITFLFVSWFMLLRLERDLPTIYVIVRRLVHNIFPPIVFGLCLAYMGRGSLSFVRTKTDIKYMPELYLGELWPSIAFDNTLWKRPFRLAKKNILLDNSATLFNNKKRFSQFFFNVCVSEGKRRLSYTYPQSLLAFQSHLEDCLDITTLCEQTDNNIYHQWANSKQNRKEQISHILFNKMEALDNGEPIENIIEHKISSLTKIEKPVRKKFDPRLAKYMQSNMLSTTIESPSIQGESNVLKQTSFQMKSDSLNLADNNALREWISIKSQEIDNTFILPWQLLEHDIDFTSLALLDHSKIANTNKLNKYTWESLLHTYKLSPKLERYQTTSEQPNLWQYLIKQSLSKLLKHIFKRDPHVYSDDIKPLLDYYKPVPLWYAQRHFIQDIRESNFKPKRLNSLNFVRRIVNGSIRGRRRKTLIWNALQKQPETPLLLRVQNIFKQEKFGYVVSVTDEQTNSYPSQIAKRFHFTLAHMVRGPALIIQSWFRKYVKQPILIVFKNIGRFLLLQQTEWSQDIGDWSREVYIYYSYDGKQYSINEKPEQWYYKGLQIRILFPFHLRPWHPNKLVAQDKINLQLQSDFDFVNNDSILKHSSYLTIWGSETEVPFGNIKKQPSFWKPTLKAIRLVISRKLNKQFIKIGKMVQPIYNGIITPLSNQNFNPINSTMLLKEESDVDKIQDTLKSINRTDSKNVFFSNQNEHNNTNKYVSNIDDTSLIILTNNRASKDVILSDRGDTYNNEIEQKLKTSFVTESEQSNKRLPYQIMLFEMKPILETNIRKDSLIGRPPIQSINKSVRNFQIKLFSQESSISIRYKLTQWNSLFVQIQRRAIYVQQNILNIVVEWFRLIQLLLKEIRINVFYLTESLKQLLLSQVIALLRTMSNSIDNIFDTYHIWKITHHKTKDLETVSETKSIDSSYITQAYILNKIWQTLIENTPKLNWINQEWTLQQGLHHYVQTQLVDQGILNCQEPNQLTQSNWNKWLEKFPQYTPSSNVWLNIMPNQYRSKVNLYWKYSKNIDLNNQYATLAINEHNQIEQKNSGLKYHTPLLQKVQKLSKRWKIYNLYRRYTDLVNNINTTPIELNSNYDINELSDLNNQTTNRFRDKIEPIHDRTENKNSSHQSIEWASTRTRIGRFSPYLPLSQLKSDNSIDEKNAEEIETLGLLSVLETYEELHNTNHLAFSSSENKLYKKENSIQPKINNTLYSQFVSTNFTKRTCFEPIYVSKLKSQLLKERFKKLFNAVRLSILAKKSGVTTNTVNSLSSSMQRDLSIFIEDLNLNQNRNESTEISEETDQDFSSKVMRNSVLFKHNLQNGRLKILDDQIFMYNMVSPILRLSNRQQNDYISNLCNSLLGELSCNLIDSILALTPEEMFLPTSSREFRLLEGLDLKVASNDYQSVSNNNLIENQIENLVAIDKILPNQKKSSYSNILSTIQIKSKQSYIIKRFLWPIYRLEDIACMNRFWVSSGNQSRFSALRIRMYPSMI